MADLQESVNFVVISQDSVAANKALMGKQKLTMPIYADPDLEAAGAFGLVFKIDDKTKELFLKYQIDLEALYGRAKPKMPTPAVYVINKDGKVAFSYVNPDYSVRLSPKVLRAVLEHGL